MELLQVSVGPPTGAAPLLTPWVVAPWVVVCPGFLGVGGESVCPENIPLGLLENLSPLRIPLASALAPPRPGAQTGPGRACPGAPAAGRMTVNFSLAPVLIFVSLPLTPEAAASPATALSLGRAGPPRPRTLSLLRPPAWRAPSPHSSDPQMPPPPYHKRRELPSLHRSPFLFPSGHLLKTPTNLARWLTC